MTEGQNKFYNYYIKRIKPDYQEQAKQLLKESFERLDNDNFDETFINRFVEESKIYIKADELPAVLEIINHFCSGRLN